MHLLFTDPSTSPRTELGRLMFGAVYGLSVVGLYALLTAAGLPTFYDKLLQVPLMNLSVRFIDRLVQWPALRHVNPEGILRRFTGYRRNLAYVCLWGVAVRAHQRDRRAWRSTSRTMAAVLAGGLPPGATARLFVRRAARGHTVSRGIRVGMQRAGHSQVRTRLRFDRCSRVMAARLRDGIRSSVRERRRRRFADSCAESDRLSNPSAGKQGTDRGVVPASAVRSGVSTAVDRCLSKCDRTAMTSGRRSHGPNSLTRRSTASRKNPIRARSRPATTLVGPSC